MVGDDNYPARGGNSRTLIIAHGIAEIEVVEHLLYKLKAGQVGVVVLELLKGFLLKQHPQDSNYRSGQLWVALDKVRVSILNEVFYV